MGSVKKMKSFSKWTIEEVEENFHIEQRKHSELLKRWTASPASPAEAEARQLVELCDKLQDHVWDWNEEELKVYFILPLLNVVNFEQARYRPFLSRELSMTYENEKISGSVDYLIAGGRRSPKRPYFFIHEYKKEHDSSNDPLGQLMIAMIAAQLLNNDAHPVYGAYIMGRYWHFTVLDGRSYSVHTGFNAADKDIGNILGVLKNTKKIIEEWIQKG